MLDIRRIERAGLETDPYRWALVDRLFAPAEAAVTSLRVRAEKGAKGKITKAVHRQGGNKIDAPRLE